MKTERRSPALSMLETQREFDESDRKARNRVNWVKFVVMLVLMNMLPGWWALLPLLIMFI
jgi:hypothetical protein